MWKTRKDFEADFFESYRRSKLQRARTIVPLGATIIGDLAKGHSFSVPKKVAAALSALDDLVLDAILWHHSFAMLLMNAKGDAEHQNLRKALCALVMKVTQDAMAIRNLIQAGYDVQARNLLRSVDEHADAIYYLCLRPETCEDFVQTNDDESANQFWWKHIRRSRKTIDDAVVKILNLDPQVEGFSKFRVSERRMLSAAHHPSYVASTVPFLIPYKSNNVTKYMFGFPSEYSYRTGRLLFYILVELALCIGLLNKEAEKIIARKRGNVLQQVVRKGRRHLGLMLLHLIQNWESPLFAESSEMNKFMDGLAD